MKAIKIDSILLFACVIPFIMTYSLSSGDTPYWLFSLIFLGLVSYIVLDILNLDQKLYELSKKICLWVVILLVLGGAFGGAIVKRHETAPIYMVHDIILQQEAAIRFMLHGQNPYSATYFNTPLAQWHYSDTEVNPALYHFVMEPFYLIFAVPFYLVSSRTIGFFDGRMPLYFLLFCLLITAQKIVKDEEKKRIFITLLAFNPAMAGYTLEGRSDMFMYAFLFFGFFLLYKNKFSLSAIFIALSFAVKQSAWPLFPFYLAFLYFKKKKLPAILKPLLVFAITFGAITLPFFLWNQKAFIDSTVLYLSGGLPHSYPISGYGLGMFLHEIGVIRDLHGYYPFSLWQILLGFPLAMVLIIYLKKSPTVKRLTLVFGIFLFVFWYLSRYFNNSHLGFLSVVFISSYFIPSSET